MHKFLYYVWLSLFGLICIPLDAKVVFVNANAPEGGDGALWGTAFRNLQDALEVVSNGDEIWVTEGTYKPDQGNSFELKDRSASFRLVDGVGLYGGFKGVESKREPMGSVNATFLSGEIDVNSTDWSMHVVFADGLGTNSTLDGFTIIKGYASGDVEEDKRGGGIYIRNSFLKIANCRIQENVAVGQGGGVFNLSSDPTFSDCNFSANLSGAQGINGYGGAIYNSSSSPSLSNCVFSENNATFQGGAIWGIHSNSALSSCLFSANRANGNGGAIYNSSSSLVLNNCVFSGNFANFGAGVYDKSSSLQFYNSVFYNNNSSNRGGGLYSFKSTSVFKNCNFVKNQATSGGGGLSVSSLSNQVPTLINCILWQNLSNGNFDHGSEGNWIGPNQSNANQDSSELMPSILEGWNGDNRGINANPSFSDILNPRGPDQLWFTQDDGLRLTQGSEAIDAGNSLSDFPPYDLAGYVRLQNQKVDLGAYEYGDQLLVLYTLSLLSSPPEKGVLIGGGNVVKDENQTISAIPPLGYLFRGWTGDLNSSETPVSIEVNAGKTITANFTKDLNDTDGDGLSNYDELVLHGTKVDNNDTDNDTLLDKIEIEIGSNPKISDLQLVNFISADIVSQIAYAKQEGNESGVAYVNQNLDLFNLYSEVDYNDSKQNAFNLGRTEGSLEGQNLVTGNPAQYNLVKQETYDEVLNELEIYKAVYVWEDYDSFTEQALLENKWRTAWWKGSQPPEVVGGRMMLSGSGRLHIPSYRTPVGSESYFSKLQQSSVTSPQMKSFAEVSAIGVYGVEGRMLIPNTTPDNTSLGLNAYKYLSDGSVKEFGVTMHKKESNKIQIEFKYTDPNSGQEVKIIRNGETDTYYRISIIYTAELNKMFMNDELIGKFSSTWSPEWFGFTGFIDGQDNWISYKTYVDDVRVLTPGSSIVMPSTPYTEGWFFIPDRGWLYTTKSIFPYFYDAATKSWMYFLSGYDLPRFYHFGTKSWILWAELIKGIETDSPDEENNIIDNSDEPSFIQLPAINNSSKTHFAEFADNLEMIWVEPGVFSMGSPETETGRSGDEFQHDVNITTGYYLGKYEVTQKQYKSVMTGNQNDLSTMPSRYVGENQPVEMVSWNDAISFCDRLTEQEKSAGRLPDSWFYTLPTEAEWEYACRAGSHDLFSWGNSIDSSLANFEGNLGQTTKVGEYNANQRGFYDMHGNVWEWTADWYDYDYPAGLAINPTGSDDGSTKVIRGGGWNDSSSSLRSAKRIAVYPLGKYEILGFRLCLKVK